MSNELDLQEETRMSDVYEQIEDIVSRITVLPVFPSLVWVWAWDVVKSIHHSYGPDSGEDYVINPALSTKDIFRLFWLHADKNGFTLEYGVGALDDHIRDWMIDNDIIISVDSEEEEV
jgi:hypothetical protein